MEIDRKNGNNETSRAPILLSDSPVVLVGGGPVLVEDVEHMLKIAPLLVAADGGAGHVLAMGHVPAAVIGDLDSFQPADHPDLPEDRVHRITEQTSTDFDKALRNIRAPLTIALGFTGARIDHELAAYHTLLAHQDRRCILLGSHDIVLHLPARLNLQLPIGTRLSLFPLQTVTGHDTGLAWPIEGLRFHPATRIGTSNVTSAPDVTLQMDGPGMLLILPRAHLPALIAAATEGQGPT